LQAARRLGAISFVTDCEHTGVNGSQRNRRIAGEATGKVADFGNAQPSAAPSYLSLSQAARLAPGRPSASATWRWCRKGLRARDGSSVHLKHVRVGRTVYTTAEWLHEFFEAVAIADQKHFEARESLAAQAAKDAAAGPPARPVACVDAPCASAPDRKNELDVALREEGL